MLGSYSVCKSNGKADYRLLLWCPANRIKTWDNPLLPLQLHKVKFTLHRHSLYLNYTQITCNEFFMYGTDRDNPHTISMFEEKFNAFRTARYIITFKEDSFRLCCDKARSKTSSVPEPLSRRTNWNIRQVLRSNLILNIQLGMRVHHCYKFVLARMKYTLS